MKDLIGKKFYRGWSENMHSLSTGGTFLCVRCSLQRDDKGLPSFPSHSLFSICQSLNCQPKGPFLIMTLWSIKSNMGLGVEGASSLI